MKKSLFKRTIISLIAFIIIVLLLFAWVNAYVKGISEDKILPLEDALSLDADCILVLGAGVWEGGRPSPMLEDRLLQGIELYNKGASNRLLMSGDHGRKEYDEVNVMKQFAIDRGIASEHIFMDHAGFSTYESMYRARDVFQVNKIIIVTQRYHLYRSLYIADKLGLKAYGVASDLRQYKGQDYRELREKIARVKDFLIVLIQPRPTYLGDSIPVSGDGNLTNDN
ncbi:MAG: ElyC/SanA/YdcF family protein [Peptostreptococcales bacterium]